MRYMIPGQTEFELDDPCDHTSYDCDCDGPDGRLTGRRELAMELLELVNHTGGGPLDILQAVVAELAFELGAKT